MPLVALEFLEALIPPVTEAESVCLLSRCVCTIGPASSRPGWPQHPVLAHARTRLRWWCGGWMASGWRLRTQASVSAHTRLSLKLRIRGQSAAMRYRRGAVLSALCCHVRPLSLLHLLQKHAVICSMYALETHELLDYCHITVLGIRCLGATKLGSRPDAKDSMWPHMRCIAMHLCSKRRSKIQCCVTQPNIYREVSVGAVNVNTTSPEARFQQNATTVHDWCTQSVCVRRYIFI